MATCAKCSKAEAEFVLRSAPSCATCLVQNSNYKYRLAVTRGLRDRRARPIFIAVALAPGSEASRLMLHYTQQDMNSPQNGSRPLFVYRYFTLALQSGNESKYASFLEVQKAAESSVVTIDLASALFSDGPHSHEHHAGAHVKYERLLAQCSDRELAHELRLLLLRVAMVRAARLWMGTSVLFVGDTCSRQASDVIADTCFGRGREIPWRVSALQDYAALGVGIVRPLVEMLQSEVSDTFRAFACSDMYLSANYIKDSFLQLAPQPAFSTPPDSSYSLVDAFVRKLEASNISTATTIVRTAAKVETDVLSAEALACCPLCLAPSQTASFCYGCSRIVDSLASKDVLPPYALHILHSAQCNDAH